MTTEYVIAFAILLFIAFAAVYLCIKNGQLEDDNERLQAAIDFRDEIINVQLEELEKLSRELAKKDSLISILRNEIEEKENV